MKGKRYWIIGRPGKGNKLLIGSKPSNGSATDLLTLLHFLDLSLAGYPYG